MREAEILCTCEFCGKPFRASRFDAKYCTPAHRTAASRARRKYKPSGTAVALVAALSAEMKEDFYFVRTNSPRAASAIDLIFLNYGQEAASLAIKACIYTIENAELPKEPDWSKELNGRAPKKASLYQAHL